MTLTPVAVAALFFVLPISAMAAQSGSDSSVASLRVTSVMRTGDDVTIALPSGRTIVVKAADMLDPPQVLDPNAPPVRIEAHGAGWYVANLSDANLDECVVRVRGLVGRLGRLMAGSKANLTSASFNDRFRLGAVLPNPIVICESHGEEVQAHVEVVDGWLRDGFERPASAAASQPAATATGGATGTIRAKCAADWPGDYAMQNFCEKQQLEALDELRRR